MSPSAPGREGFQHPFEGLLCATQGCGWGRVCLVIQIEGFCSGEPSLEAGAVLPGGF